MIVLYEGELWPLDEYEAAEPIPEELWEMTLNDIPNEA